MSDLLLRPDETWLGRVCSETVARMDAGPKPTWMYLRRVSEQTLASQVGPAAISRSKRAKNQAEKLSKILYAAALYPTK